jgi:hypothetical protein
VVPHQVRLFAAWLDLLKHLYATKRKQDKHTITFLTKGTTNELTLAFGV